MRRAKADGVRADGVRGRTLDAGAIGGVLVVAQREAERRLVVRGLWRDRDLLALAEYDELDEVAQLRASIRSVSLASGIVSRASGIVSLASGIVSRASGIVSRASGALSPVSATEEDEA